MRGRGLSGHWHGRGGGEEALKGRVERVRGKEAWWKRGGKGSLVGERTRGR